MESSQIILDHQIREKDLVGFKYFKKILKLLDRLHLTATRRDKAHKRTLHYDQHVALLLLYFFNPILESLRGVVSASQLKKVQKKLNCVRASLGSLSEANRIFDADLLLPIINELAGQCRPIAHDARLDQVKGILTLVDATLLADRVYVMDRGYACFELLGQILLAQSSFVCRVRDNTVYDLIEERPLTSEAIEAGIVSDRIVTLGSKTAEGRVTRPLRLIEIKCTPHRKRIHGGRHGPAQSQTLLIATNLLDLPAEVIGLIFRCRWEIEIFFRFFKHVLGCRHLLAHNPNGIKIQTYAADSAYGGRWQRRGILRGLRILRGREPLMKADVTINVTAPLAIQITAINPTSAVRRAKRPWR